FIRAARWRPRSAPGPCPRPASWPSSISSPASTPDTNRPACGNKTQDGRSMMMRCRMWMATALFATLLVGAAAATAEVPKRWGVPNFAVVAEPPNYDCHGSTTFALIHPIAPHYSLLVKFDGKDYPKVVGDLAQSWSVAPDGMSYTFKLKSGVKFHDGSPLTSADIKASYDRIINPPQGVVSIRKSYYSDLLVETPDPHTVVFKLKNPMAGVLEALASPYNCIYSAAKLKQNPRYPETEIMGSG